MRPQNSLSIPGPLDRQFAEFIRAAVETLNSALEEAHRAELVLNVYVEPGLPGTEHGKAPIVYAQVLREV